MQQQKSVRHIAALAYADAGIAVFPVQVNGKEPLAGSASFHDASANPEQIDRWWSEADYNLAVRLDAAGWSVIDIDGSEGEKSFAEFVGDLPETYEVKSPHGRHLYFTGDELLPPTVSRLGYKIDTRGQNSYVLVPPSVVDGKPYEVLHDREFAKLPPGVTGRLRGRSREALSVGAELDSRISIDRAKRLLLDCVERGDVAVSGRNGNDRTYKLAVELLNLGVSQDVCRSLLTEVWNPHCIPPWSDDELGVLIDNASRYGQNEEGAWGVSSPAEAFGPVLDRLIGAAPGETRSRFHAENETEQEEGADPSWLIPKLLPEQSTILMVGQTGSYKSFLAMDIALSIASSTAYCGSTPLLTGPVFYAASEGRHSLKKARRRAWKIAHEFAGGIPDFYVMPAPMIMSPDDVRDFGDEIVRRSKGKPHPALIVLDTVAKCMAGLNENDAGDATRFSKFCDSLVETFHCSVIAVHHQSDKEGAALVRGSSALRANFDTLWHVEGYKATKAAKLRVLQHKDADEPEHPWTFEGRKIGPALAFFPTTPEEHRLLTGKDDAFDPRKIGAALKELKAFGYDNGVSTHVLAGKLVVTDVNTSEESRQSLIAKTARSLGGLSQSKLEAYCERRAGKPIVWCLPEPSGD